MKREVEREVRLPAFQLERGDLELLWQRMASLFDASLPIRSKISLSLPSERLTFDSIEELTAYPGLAGQVTKFLVEMRQGPFLVVLSSGGGLLAASPSLKAEGDSDIWCAGAVEAVTNVIRQRRVWYFWLTRFPFTIVFIVLAFAPWLKVGPFQNFPAMSSSFALTWVALTALFGYFSLLHERVIPSASIVFTRELGFVRRYAGELGLLLGVISLALAVYMWVVPFGK